MLGDCVGMDANYLPTPIPLQLHSVPRLLLKDAAVTTVFVFVSVKGQEPLPTFVDPQPFL